MTIKLANEHTKSIWDKSVNHPLQSWAWGEFRKAMGIDVVRFVTKRFILSDPEHKRGRIEGQLTFHKIPYTPFTIGYFPKGPRPSRGMIDDLFDLGKKKRAIFIQLEPNVLNNFQFPISNFKLLTPSHHPLFTKYTFVLDLTKSEEELLKAMHPKTRYNIRLAQKHGVSVQEDNSSQAFEAYQTLAEETTQRQGFYAHNPKYHQYMWEILSKAGIAHQFSATYQKKILAVWIIFAWKDTIYYPYGASSRQHREVMAPNLLLWEIALWGKKNGFKKFDLWGALGPSPAGEPDINDPWYGFHRFKEGYNPQLVEFIGSYDLVINPFLYQIYKFADRIRWRLLKFIK